MLKRLTLSFGLVLLAIAPSWGNDGDLVPVGPSPAAPQAQEGSGADDQALVKPAVDAVVSLVNQSTVGGASAPAVVEEHKVQEALLGMLRQGRSLGLRFAGFTLGKFKGGTAGISGQIGKELVFFPDSKDSKDPRIWKVAVYSVSSYGVGLAAQAGMGYSVGIIFDMKDVDDYRSSFCAATGLFGNVVDFGVSFRIGCGLADFFNLAKAFASRKLGQSSSVSQAPGDAPENQEKVVQISKDQGTINDQNIFLEQVRSMLGDGRPKVISGSVAAGVGLPVGVILTFQPHKQLQSPKEVSLDSIQQLITDELL